MTRQSGSLLWSLAAGVAFVTPLALVLYTQTPLVVAGLILLGTVCGVAVLVLHLVTRRRT
jgi:hypothetical protein